jgi:hypothetical protein
VVAEADGGAWSEGDSAIVDTPVVSRIVLDKKI